MIPYAFHPDAEAELEAAALFYESQVRGLGTSFAEAIEHTIARVRTHPEGTPTVRSTVRRTLVPRFPYAVVYRFDRASILILAIAHLHRHPGYWRGRQG